MLLPGDPPNSFPPVEKALTDPDGLLAIGGDLSPERLVEAYRRGIFPWFDEDELPMWWAPAKRAVLYTDELQCSKSLRKRLRNDHFTVSGNQCFEEVIRACAVLRLNSGTWITSEMFQAYNELHRLGYAHSIETWQDDELVGGLYGVQLGGLFFGESMFSTASDASKVALVTLVDRCRTAGIPIIDCQQPSAHLARLGMRLISRERFSEELAAGLKQETDPAVWTFEPQPTKEPTAEPG